MDDGLGGCLGAVVILAVIGWVLVNYWPIVLGVVLVGGIGAAAYAFRPPPDPKNEINKAAREAEKSISKAGKAYRKRVKELTK